ncbi:MAG: FprA family A-type flavoprotein [Bacteroidales bacterium]|nr:FprA family A-type flavoprotein [Bacteroidales bacterium]
MQNIRKINNDLYYVGASDRRLSLFENVYPVPRGVSYNSYLLRDEKTVLMDTADCAVREQYFENVAAALDGRTLDYLVVNHMEPDHAALIADLLLRYPETMVVTTAKAAQMMEQFFGSKPANLQAVKEGDQLCTGRHTLTFVMAPMVHWPEVMMTYDIADKTLFSADAFGTFGALNGNIFADEVNFDRDWLDDARRYYINIVGKYGVQVQNVLKKAAGLPIEMICPLHGPVWRQDLAYFIGKHDTWSSYRPEEEGVLVIYGSIYGHTASAAEKMAAALADHGVKGIAMYDASHTDASQLVAECFRYSHLVLASSTYNAGIFTPIENLLHDLKAHSWQNRTVAIIENGTWAAQSGKAMRTLLEEMKNITILGEDLSLKSAMKETQMEDLEFLANLIIANLHNEQ